MPIQFFPIAFTKTTILDHYLSIFFVCLPPGVIRVVGPLEMVRWPALVARCPAQVLEGWLNWGSLLDIVERVNLRRIRFFVVG